VGPSSRRGHNKALEIIQARYHPSLWNLYAFHCSDGDNFDSDNPSALRAAKELSEVCNLFGYGEIKPLGSRYYESSMLNIFRRLDADNFQTVLIERKEDIWPSFKAFPPRGARAPDSPCLGTLKDSSTGTRASGEVAEFDCYPQEFEIRDHAQMLGHGAWDAVALPRWSAVMYGRKTLYDYGVFGIPGRW
jgi:hypothetical protein